MATGILLTACAQNNLASVQEVANAFPRAEYQVLGKTRNDQHWIDSTIEAEVAGFGFKRPTARPASWDIPVKAPRKVVAEPAAAVVHPAPLPWLTHPFLTTPAPAPVPAPVAAPPAVQPAPPAPPPKKTRVQKLKDRIKQLEQQLKKYTPHDTHPFRG